MVDESKFSYSVGGSTSYIQDSVGGSTSYKRKDFLEEH